jgi:hypothetical protein
MMRSGGMSSDKKVYLAAILVMAFGLGNSQIRKHMDWFECLSSRIHSRVTDHAPDSENRFESVLERAVVRGENRIVRDQNALVRVEVKTACAQARMAQRQAEMVRSQIEKVRVMNLGQVHRTEIIDRENAIRDVLNRTVLPKIDVNIETADDKI